MEIKRNFKEKQSIKYQDLKLGDCFCLGDGLLRDKDVFLKVCDNRKTNAIRLSNFLHEYFEGDRVVTRLETSVLEVREAE